MRIVEIVGASLFLLIGVRVAAGSVRRMEPGKSAGDRVLLALHEVSRAGFWLALGTLFLAFAVIEEPETIRWFVLVPIGMAGTRLLTAALLAR